MAVKHNKSTGRKRYEAARLEVLSASSREEPTAPFDDSLRLCDYNAADIKKTRRHNNTIDHPESQLDASRRAE